MGAGVPRADRATRAPRDRPAGVVRVGHRHAAARESRRGRAAARPRDGRPRPSGRSALAVLCGQAARRRASVVDAARAVRALARTLPRRRQGGLSQSASTRRAFDNAWHGACLASRHRWIEWRFVQACGLREPPFLLSEVP
ncbi:hypothetical protein BVI434_2210009 [Burkholderia vietnamiensis]|nr:hypothetical protein BVI434_2210009 [Burkholderia vietnamiensis]